MERTHTIIEPTSSLSLNVKELWHYRELLYFFAWRDVKVKYKQTALGVFWVLLQPLALMLLFTLLFSKTSFAQYRSDMPYALFVLSGLIIWNFFSNAVSHASDSMVANANIIKKIFFPRLLIPISAIATALLDFSIAFLIFLVFCLMYRHSISWTALVYFPAAVLVGLLTAFGLGTLLGALNVKYRDFRYALPFVLQALFFATQIIYPASIIQTPWLNYAFALNPMNAAIELFRTPIAAGPANTEVVIIGILSSVILATSGLLYFKKTELYFADII